MSTIEKLKKKGMKAGKSSNQSETKTGGGGNFEPAPEGRTSMRLLEYIELGVQPQRAYQGQKKPDAPTVRITFELLGKAHLKEVETKDGKKVTIANRHSETLTLSLHEKAKFKKLFNAMTAAYANPGEITHMAQMIGDAFMGTIRHEVKEREGKKFTYVHLTNKDGSFMISAPVREEMDEDGNVTAVKKIKVPDLVGEPKVFIFEDPTKEDWDALHIDGEREVKDEDGKTVKKSKNFLQELIMRAKNFKGSAVEALIGGMPDLEEDEDEDEDIEDEELDEEEDETPPKKAPKKGEKAKVKKPAEEDEEDDELEEIDDVEDEDDEVEELDEEEEEEEEEVKPKAKAKKSAPVKGKAASSAKTKSPSKGKKSGDVLNSLIDDDEE